MKKFIVLILSIIFLGSCLNNYKTNEQSNHKESMNTRFFTQDEFYDNFSQEMVSSQEVYDRMKKNGLVDYQLCKFDFDFISNKKKNLDALKSFLESNYGYSLREPEKQGSIWMLWGEALEFPVDDENILYWALNLYYQGYKYDSKLSGYGAIVDTNKFENTNASNFDAYFNKALDSYNKGDLGSAIINWSTCIRINPKDPNSYYSRAIVKDELFAWKSALRDYDKAIEIAPDFVDALVNRGASRDESGDHKGAIEDYTKVISLEPNNSTAYLNRGNSNFNRGLKDKACKDWEKASILGDEIVTNRLNEKCE